MSETAALVIQVVLFCLAGLAALTSVVVYVLTEGEAGGFFFLLFLLLTYLLGVHIFDLTDAVLSGG